jgi:hypothetical protein
MDKTPDYVPAAIEAEFVASWDATSRFFKYVNERWSGPNTMIQLIEELRIKGFDRTLRAGTALTTFIVSRSRQHGLRRGQARIIFSVYRDNTMNVRYFENIEDAREFTQPIGEELVTPEIEALLTWLVSEPIN